VLLSIVAIRRTRRCPSRWRLMSPARRTAEGCACRYFATSLAIATAWTKAASAAFQSVSLESCEQSPMSPICEAA
jgi:hypothetical protein